MKGRDVTACDDRIECIREGGPCVARRVEVPQHAQLDVDGHENIFDNKNGPIYCSGG
jgi:hypothetical protein